MRVLLVGSGGREHALAWKIAQSPALTELLIAPGNPGTERLGRNVPVDVTQTAMLVDIARRERIDLVVVGPEAPLAAGLADAMLAAGLRVFGPTAAAAQIESSKAFAKRIMEAAGIPTAQAHIFTSAADAAEFARASARPWVVKADGLAAGKGVVVAADLAETEAAIGQLGATGAGQLILLEERLEGPELSLLALCDGARLLALPPARDHKRLGDGDTGPNTGGMGAVAPIDIGAELLDEIVGRMMLPVVRALAAEGTPFRGALYAGLMLTPTGPRVLEFNARFGDPETQAIMPLLEGDLLSALAACADGRLDLDSIRWRHGAAACLVAAAAGYPERPRRGDPISGLESVEREDQIVFQAGTAWDSGQLVTSGGRVLGLVGTGQTIAEALGAAYDLAEIVTFPGAQLRRDIGGRRA